MQIGNGFSNLGYSYVFVDLKWVFKFKAWGFEGYRGVCWRRERKTVREEKRRG